MSPTTWVALLRGINVGGKKRVAMSDLRALLESLGCRDVRTYVQSGNAVFTAERGKAKELEHDIASAIDAELRLDVKVLVRTATELTTVVDGNPFAVPRADPKQLHVVFLSAAPAADKIANVDRARLAPDQFEPGSRVLYLRLVNGIAGSRTPDWERLLGLTATTRNWNTVTRLHALAAG
jgi:uncharacterized protein (DUF1697 family)